VFLQKKRLHNNDGLERSDYTKKIYILQMQNMMVIFPNFSTQSLNIDDKKNKMNGQIK